VRETGLEWLRAARPDEELQAAALRLILWRLDLPAGERGPLQLCSGFGPTCDALDTISLAEQLPDLHPGDHVYSENIGAYSAASSTRFNGFPPATVVHVHR
jgi:diaminopimelate decarboxylase